MSSENQVQENQSENPIQNQTLEEAPYLCWGQSELMIDASVAKACQHRVYFVKLMQIAQFEEEENNELRYVSLYYYEYPLFMEEKRDVPQKGIVIETISKYRNEYHQTTQTAIQLEFLPIKLRLF